MGVSEPVVILRGYKLMLVSKIYSEFHLGYSFYCYQTFNIVISFSTIVNFQVTIKTILVSQVPHQGTLGSKFIKNPFTL